MMVDMVRCPLVYLAVGRIAASDATFDLSTSNTCTQNGDRDLVATSVEAAG